MRASVGDKFECHWCREPDTVSESPLCHHVGRLGAGSEHVEGLNRRCCWRRPFVDTVEISRPQTDSE